MKTQRIVLTLLASMLIGVPVRAQVDEATEIPTERHRTFATEEARWKAFTTQVRLALESDHHGLKQSALRYIIQYGDRLKTNRSDVFEVVRIYRDHENDTMRRMAVVALGQMQDDWAIDFLTRSARFEKTPSVRHTIKAVVARYRSGSEEPGVTPALQIAEDVK